MGGGGVHTCIQLFSGCAYMRASVSLFFARLSMCTYVCMQTFPSTPK